MNIRNYHITSAFFTIGILYFIQPALAQHISLVDSASKISHLPNQQQALMTSLDTMPDALYFPKILRGTPSEEFTEVQVLEKKSRQLSIKYHDELDNKHAFSGLYGVANFQYRPNRTGANKQGADYVYGLEWEIFRRGYYQYKQELKKKKLESRVQRLQLEENMRMRALDEQIYYLNRLRLTVQTISVKKILDLTKRQLAIAKKKLLNGYITRNEYSEYSARQIDAEVRYTRLSSMELVKIPPAWFAILDNATSLHLVNKYQLFKQACKVSPALALQGQFEKRADFFPKWTEHFSLRLYVHRRQQFGTSTENIIGIRAQVPLEWQSSRDDIVNIEKNSYRLQASSIRARIKQKIFQINSEFQFEQSKVWKLAGSYEKLGKKIISYEKLAAAGITSMQEVPENELRQYKRERITIIRDVWLARLDVLEKVLRLTALTQPSQAKELFLDAFTERRVVSESIYKHPIAPIMHQPIKIKAMIVRAYETQKQDVLDALESWRSAWSQKNQDVYFMFYAETFKPEHRNSIQKWKQIKQRFFANRKKINVTLADIQVKIIQGTHRAQVRFNQHYEAGNYHSDDYKKLIFEKNASGWKIIREAVILPKQQQKDTKGQIATSLKP